MQNFLTDSPWSVVELREQRLALTKEMLKGQSFKLFKIYKPKSTLKEGDLYKSKPQLAAEIIEELQGIGYKFNLVLANSLYGESSNFIKVLKRFKLDYVLAIRSNHAMWLPE